VSFEVERRERLHSILNQLHRERKEHPRVLVEAPTAVLNQEFEALPPGVHLSPGRIVLEGFSTPDEAKQKLLALIMAMGNDPQTASMPGSRSHPRGSREVAISYLPHNYLFSRAKSSAPPSAGALSHLPHKYPHPPKITGSREVAISYLPHNYLLPISQISGRLRLCPQSSRLPIKKVDAGKPPYP
jgi:hypothetical protein